MRRVKYEKCFPSFSYFAIYFIKQENMRNGGNICYIARVYLAITSLLLAQK